MGQEGKEQKCGKATSNCTILVLQNLWLHFQPTMTELMNSLLSALGCIQAAAKHRVSAERSSDGS
eukprot:3953438-Karenia_brevis.AAC.1